MPMRPPILRPPGWRPAQKRPNPAHAIYHTPEWRKLRSRVIARDGGRCTAPTCDTPDRGFGGKLIADHIDPANHPGLCDPIWLRTLCPTCDNRRHREKGGDRS